MSAAPEPGDSGAGGVVVIGHSGATGYNSDPELPDRDAPANSWATGTNPDVESVYLRLLATDPAIDGNVNNYAISGSDALSLIHQAGEAVAIRPKPSLVLIQSIDNDMRCDGTDSANYEPYRAKLTTVMDILTDGLPEARVFFVDQFADVRTYDRVVSTIDPDHIAGDGPCDTADPGTKKIDPAKEAHLQSLVDDYFGIIGEVCAKYPNCRTDGGAIQHMPLEPEDLAPDLDHLSVSGLAKMAEIEFEAMTAAFR